MSRRSKPGGEPAKLRRGKRSTPKRHNAPKARRNRGVSIASQGTVVARLTGERDEALLRETANSEILRLISKSPGDLDLVFRTILEHATSICNANFGTLFRFDGENLYPVAQFNTPAALLEAQTRRGPFQPTRGTAMEHVFRTKQVSHSADKAAEPVPGFFAEHGGARTQVIVPMLKDDALIGAIVIYRTVSNVASRLCDEAKPGQILISPRVRLAVDKAVTTEAVGEFTLKGIRRPMTTYNVLEPLPSKPN